MKTIEERAKEYASKKADISLSAIYNEALARIYEEAYIAGASDQKDIDVANACKANEEELLRLKRELYKITAVPANLMPVDKSLSAIRREMEEGL